MVFLLEKEITKYIFNGINVVSIYGGINLPTLIDCLNDKKLDIVIATLGRLNYLIDMVAIKIDHVSYLVIYI